jgi:hypothetical protein
VSQTNVWPLSAIVTRHGSDPVGSCIGERSQICAALSSLCATTPDAL